ncbi:hypothetical protein SADUNF_Sadunf05G0112100 [Salix dunnii]|uniref:Uncharacterized protein n=1 Tax=Salix dunnii TaxID=1413687 RepID=A0A835KCI9_9ROSI|nr:hypothetical protein SADUNF_Sadunf05G0112100 [Salix dunnii]
MMDPWWSLLGAAIPAIIAGQALRMKKRGADEQRLKSARGREKSSDEIFICERVCTSKRMLKKVGALSKDPTVDTCVTVCGVSELDACADACARTVCVNQHQLPNWNDICLRRCQRIDGILCSKWKLKFAFSLALDMLMNCSTICSFNARLLDAISNEKYHRGVYTWVQAVSSSLMFFIEFHRYCLDFLSSASR